MVIADRIHARTSIITFPHTRQRRVLHKLQPPHPVHPQFLKTKKSPTIALQKQTIASSVGYGYLSRSLDDKKKKKTENKLFDDDE